MQRKNAVKEVSHLIAAWWSVQKTTSLKKTIRWWDDGFLWRLISVYLVSIMIMISLQEAFSKSFDLKYKYCRFSLLDFGCFFCFMLCNSYVLLCLCTSQSYNNHYCKLFLNFLFLIKTIALFYLSIQSSCRHFPFIKKKSKIVRFFLYFLLFVEIL